MGLLQTAGNRLAVVEKPPYEVSEVGWGEFEIVIKIHFNSPTERPITLYHMLKLVSIAALSTASEDIAIAQLLSSYIR
jgi:transcription initiation factor IIF auxiliary subunit